METKSMLNEERLKTVLLVEDEPILREMAVLILEQDGFRVLAASDSIEANRIWRIEKESVDILVTDMEIPGVSGVELAESFKEEKPTLNVIIATGSVELPDALVSSLKFRFQFLAKPYSPKNLIAAVYQSSKPA